MKYNDNGEWKDIIVKATDTLPIGTEVDYDGTTVPDGWEEVEITDENPIGTIKITTDNINPGTYLGGTWELIRDYHGGELIGFGCDTAGSSTGSTQTGSTVYAWSDASCGALSSRTTTRVDYTGHTCLWYDSGTFRIYTNGIVGYVKGTLALSGLGSANSKGFWFLGTSNALPTGVTFLPSNSNNLLAFGPYSDNYGGVTYNFSYYVDDTCASNASFYINPKFEPYTGDFTPNAGGVKSYLMVEVYTKGGTHYEWKRTA